MASMKPSRLLAYVAGLVVGAPAYTYGLVWAFKQTERLTVIDADTYTFLAAGFVLVWLGTLAGTAALMVSDFSRQKVHTRA